MEANKFPENLVKWSDIARGIGEVALASLWQFVTKRHSETPLHRPEHYVLRVEHPKPNVSVYEALQLDFEAQAYGSDKDLPPYDSEGRYLSNDGIEG